MCLLAPSPWMLGPSGAPCRSPLHSSGSPRPRTQGRRPQPRYQRRLLVAFAALPGPPFDHSWALLSHSRFDERGPRFRINYRSACPYQSRFDVSRITHTHTRARARPVSSAGELILKNQERREGFSMRAITGGCYSGLCSGSGPRSRCRCSPRLLLLFLLSPCSLFLPRFDQFSRGEKGRARAFRGTQASRNLWRTTDRCHEIHRCCPAQHTRSCARQAGVFVCSLTGNGDCHLRFLATTRVSIEFCVFFLPSVERLPLVARRGSAPRQNGVWLPNPFVTQLEKTSSRYTACRVWPISASQPTLRSQRLPPRRGFLFFFFFFLIRICHLRAHAASKLVNFERERCALENSIVEESSRMLAGSFLSGRKVVVPKISRVRAPRSRNSSGWFISFWKLPLVAFLRRPKSFD